MLNPVRSTGSRSTSGCDATSERSRVATPHSRADETRAGGARPALSQVPSRPPGASEVLEVVTFDLGGECYAIATRHVRRVVKLERLTSIPGTPEPLVGVINLQGEILAVFDLRVLFGIVRQGPTEWSRVVVLGEDRDEFGVLADSTQEVRTVRLDELFPAPEAREGEGRQFVRGVTGEGLIVLDGPALLLDDRLVINQVEEPGVY